MSDNKQIKDGLGKLFSIRMRDLTADNTLMQQHVFASLLPLEYGAGGMFQETVKSGIMAADMVGNSPIYAFRWPVVSPICLVRRVRIYAWALTASTAGIVKFELYTARPFTSQDTGGAAADLSVHNCKMRTSMASSQAFIQYANTAALTPGTRTLGAAPTDCVVNSVGATAPILFAGNGILLNKLQGEYPLILAQDEGFVIQATVPAAGTWSYTVNAEWDEITVY